MSLDDIFMPPIRIDGTRIRSEMPLGPWPETVVRTPDEREAAKRAKAKRYRDSHREERIAYHRAYRAAKRKAA